RRFLFAALDLLLKFRESGRLIEGRRGRRSRGWCRLRCRLRFNPISSEGNNENTGREHRDHEKLQKMFHAASYFEEVSHGFTRMTRIRTKSISDPRYPRYPRKSAAKNLSFLISF